MKGTIMEKRIYTAGEIKIEVDKYEDKKAKEHRMMAYAFKMIREESGMTGRILLTGWEFHTGQCRNGNWEEELCRNMYLI